MSLFKKSSKAQPFIPSLCKLEDRCVPAAFVFGNGQLTINMNEIQDRRITLDADIKGNLLINGRVAGGSTNFVEGAVLGKPNLLSITSIVVNGSGQKDTINFSKVDTQFNNLDGRVVIYGNGGDDNIQGTQFSDRIFAGSGNDVVFGLGGNDEIYGQDGNDTLWGDGNTGYWDRYGGNDKIDGGVGNDNLRGSGGKDILIGGVGKDTYSGGTGDDLAIIDSKDEIPKHGWANWGIEKVKR